MMNNYILEYYQALKDGTEVAGMWVHRWYEYVVHGLNDRAFFFSQKKAQKAIRFMETFCRHSEGRRDLVRLELWQKAFVSVVFGIVDAEGTRQFREVFLLVGRKNGKTLLSALAAAAAFFCDNEYGARLYFVAPKLEQATVCFNDLVQIIQKDPELSKVCRKRRTDLYIESTNSTAKPLAFNAGKSDGLNPHLVVMDECASWRGVNGLRQYEVLKSAGGARRQPLFLTITTAGYEDEGIFDELMKRSTALLNGGSRETRLAPFLYMIDDPTKWNDLNELRKSNPNLGVSVSVDYMLEEIAIAEGSISKRAEFMCKYCDIKQNSSAAWLDAATVAKACRDPLRLEDFRGCYAVCGVDLSQTTDLTAVTTVIERGGVMHVFARFFLPAEKLDEATARDGLPYAAYLRRGLLQLSGENFIDYNDVFQYVRDLVERFEIYPLKIGYDRYSAVYLVQQLQAYGFQCEDVYQGDNLSGVINEAEGLLKDGAVNIGDNDLLKIHFLNSALKLNTERGRRRLVKVANSAAVHIDGMAAWLDALTVRQKYFDEIGGQLANRRN